MSEYEFMRRLEKYSLAIWIILVSQSCIPPSTDQVVQLTKPDNNIIKDFGYTVSGQVLYQFYQQYGFTDLEEQLIMIVRPGEVDYLISVLPFDTLDINRLEKIDMRKFIKGKSIMFAPEKAIHSDIRLTSQEYDSGQTITVFHEAGKYGWTQTDTTETIFVFDSKTNLLYVESKKWK
ncbi:MAG: hypothetical protein AAF399_05055 [Bacteroidota bacterium]